MRDPSSADSTPANSSDQVLDIGVFHDIRDSLAQQPDALAEVYRKFLANAAVLIESLAAQDSGARAGTLHTLKGSAAMVGANRLAAMAARMQIDSSPSAGELIGQLRAELDAFRHAIVEQLHGLVDSTAF